MAYRGALGGIGRGTAVVDDSAPSQRPAHGQGFDAWFQRGTTDPEPGFGGGQGGGRGQNRRSDGCQICHDPDHYARECPQRQQRYSAAADGCHICHETGHFARECPEKQQRYSAAGGQNDEKKDGGFGGCQKEIEYELTERKKQQQTAAVRHRQSLEKEKEEPPKRFWQRHPKLAWVVIGVLAIALIIAIVAIVVQLVLNSSSSSSTVETSPSPSSKRPQLKEPCAGNVQTFFQSVCIEKHSGVTNSCLVGPAPSIDSCSSGICTRFLYMAIPRGGLAHHFLDKTPDYSTTETPKRWVSDTGSRQLCRISNNQLGVCSDTGECDKPYNCQEEYFDDDGQWVDNGDKPNPCWDETSVFGSNVQKDGVISTREECKRQTKACDQRRDAFIWIQHLMCKVPEHRMVKNINNCQGLPLRLWFCQHCQSSTGVPGCQGNLTDDGCTYSCIRTVPPMLGKVHVWKKDNGANCTIKGETGEAYCFDGQCFKSAGVLKDHNGSL